MGNKRNRKIKSLGYFSDKYFQSADYNRRSFTLYREWIMALAMSRYKWINLPSTCDERFLEWTLLTQGVATIATPKKGKFKDKWYSTQVAGNAPINIYDNPSRWISYGNSGWRFQADTSNGILIYDNLLRIPISNKIDYFARKLAAYDRTIDVNLHAQHTPVILACTQEMKNDVIQIYKQFAGGEPGILGTKGLSDIANDIKVLDLGVDFLVEELQVAQDTLWNQVFQFLGILSLPRKSERMIEAEVTANNEPTDLRALDGLITRRQACEKLNKRFGLNINCVWRKDNESENYNIEHNIKDKSEIEDNKDTKKESSNE